MIRGRCVQENGEGPAKIPMDATDATWASRGGVVGGEVTMQPLSSHTNGESNGASNGSTLDSLNGSRGGVFPTSAGKDPTTQVTPLAPLTLALDALCANRGKFLEKYTPLGLAHRRLGRTAVVQIFEDPDTQRRYAIKFYRSRTSFDCERAAYGRTSIADAVAVPQHGIVTEPGTGPDGYRWPPCIVMDVGEPLDTFLGRVPRGDEATIRTALADIAAVIETLHSKGWAHRNLKPSNILFLAEGERWVLCDLERCSRVGAPHALHPLHACMHADCISSALVSTASLAPLPSAQRRAGRHCMVTEPGTCAGVRHPIPATGSLHLPSTSSFQACLWPAPEARVQREEAESAAHGAGRAIRCTAAGMRTSSGALARTLTTRCPTTPANFWPRGDLLRLRLGNAGVNLHPP